MPIRLSCSSCNTAFTLPEVPADQRTTCPRCGDMFPIRTFSEIPASEAGNASLSGLESTTTSRKSHAGQSHRRSAAIALSMGMVGLVVGVVAFTQHFGSQPPPAPAPEPSAKAFVPPMQLVGLGYLPGDDNIVFAIEPGPILAYAAEKNADPREFLIQAGVPGELLDSLTSLGISLQQIDHLVGGASLGDTVAELRLTLVLVLNHPLADEAAFFQKLKARDVLGKNRRKADLAGIPFTLYLARVSPTIWVFGVDEKDFQAVDQGGYGPGGRQILAGSSRSITDHIPVDASLWVATGEANWAEKPIIKLIVLAKGLVKKEWLNALAKGRAGIAAVSFNNPRLQIFVTAADAKTAEQIRAYFQKQAAASEGAHHGGSGDSAFYNAFIDPKRVLTTLKQFADAAGQSASAR